MIKGHLCFCEVENKFKIEGYVGEKLFLLYITPVM